MEEPQQVVHEERLFTGYTGRISIALSLGWLVTQAGRKLIPPLLPMIIENLGITSSKAGLALTLMGAIRALTLYPGGRSSDRLSRTTILVTGLTLMGLGYVALIVTVSYSTFLFGVAIVGLGAGLYSIPTRAFISELFVKRRGQALGIFSAAGTMGSALAAGIAIVVLKSTTWQMAFIPMIGLLLFAGTALHYWSRESYVITRVDLKMWETITRVFETTELRRLVIVYTFVIFTWTGVLSFLPTFLQVEKGFSATVASGWFAIPSIAGVLVMPVAGGLSDRFSRLRVVVGAILVTIVGLTIMLFTVSLLWVTVGIVVFSGGLMSYPPVMQSHLLESFPTENAGGDFGAFKTVYSGLASLGPTYVGVVASVTSYTLAYSGLIICLLFGLGIVISTIGRN